MPVQSCNMTESFMAECKINKKLWCQGDLLILTGGIWDVG